MTNARDMKCFGHVARVIGEDLAEYHLDKVLNSGSPHLGLSVGDPLVWAFNWGASPQGDAFWRAIYNETVPTNISIEPHEFFPRVGDKVLYWQASEEKWVSADVMAKHRAFYWLFLGVYGHATALGGIGVMKPYMTPEEIKEAETIESAANSLPEDCDSLEEALSRLYNSGHLVKPD